MVGLDAATEPAFGFEQALGANPILDGIAQGGFDGAHAPVEAVAKARAEVAGNGEGEQGDGEIFPHGFHLRGKSTLERVARRPAVVTTTIVHGTVGIENLTQSIEKHVILAGLFVLTCSIIR